HRHARSRARIDCSWSRPTAVGGRAAGNTEIGTMKHISLILTLGGTTTYGLHAIEKHKAAYAGGTIATFNAEGGSIGGRIETSDSDRLVFIADERPLADMPLRV